MQTSIEHDKVFKQISESMSQLKDKLNKAIDECLDFDYEPPFYKDINKKVLYTKYSELVSHNTRISQVGLLASKQIIYYRNIINSMSEDKSIPLSLLKMYVDRIKKQLEILDTLNKQLTNYRFAIGEALKFYNNLSFILTSHNLNTY